MMGFKKSIRVNLCDCFAIYANAPSWVEKILVGLFSIGFACVGGSSAFAEDRTNVVLIIVDDMGYSDIGCYGSEIPTPNIDSLAENGLRFRQFYNTAKCWTTRASLLTGLYYHQVTELKILERKGVTIAEALGENGYRTIMSGKWHLSGGQLDNPEFQPLARGFDEFYGTILGAGSFYDPYTLQDGDKRIEPDEDFYYTDAITEHAVNSLRAVAKEGTPFFHYVAYTAPHWPMQAPPEEIEKYKHLYRKGWDAIREERYAKQLELGVVDARWGASGRDSQVAAWDENDPDREWQIHRMATYAAMLNIVDRGVGQIIDQLKTQGAFDNTLILFMSDNGGSPEDIGFNNGVFCLGGSQTTLSGTHVQVGRDTGVLPGPEETFQGVGREWANVNNTPFREFKNWCHEGGIATPLIAHWPKGIARKGELSDEVSHVIDIMATCLEVTGTSYPIEYKGNRIIPHEGKSLASTFAGKTLGERTVFWDYANHAAVRSGKWKLLAPSTKKIEWELYDMEADRCELNDLADDFPEKVQAMGDLYKSWQAHVGPDRNKAKPSTAK